MKTLLNLSTRTKLLLGFALPVLLLLLVSAGAYQSLQFLEETQDSVNRRQVADALDLFSYRAENNGVRASMLNLLYSPKQERARWEKDIRERVTKLRDLLNGLIERNQSEPEFSRRLAELNKAQRDYDAFRETRIQPLIEQEKTAEAQNLLMGEQEERFVTLRQLSSKLSDEEMAQAKLAFDRARQNGRLMRRIILLTGVVAVLLSLGLAWGMTRVTAFPLQTMAGLTEKLSSGDLRISFPLWSRRDEIGVMRDSLQRLVENFRTINRGILESAQQLASSSSEIFTATTQTASSTAETATAVSQATATVEEVRQTVEVNNQKARQVSETANHTLERAQSGAQAVEELISNMSLIRTQIEKIGDGALQLSDKSQSIGEIMVTVNEIAEQSNLLAVNAAIEAAKAGEHGRGFAVIAQEIRTLAEQSKRATGQVRTILSEIQKAITGVVRVTERGSRTVETGVQLSTEAQDAISLLSNSVTESSEAALQIFVSSQQQTIGMDQIALAMGNIKKASAENATGMKQIESSARHLYELGQNLKQMTEAYQV